MIKVKPCLSFECKEFVFKIGFFFVHYFLLQTFFLCVYAEKKREKERERGRNQRTKKEKKRKKKTKQKKMRDKEKNVGTKKTCVYNAIDNMKVKLFLSFFCFFLDDQMNNTHTHIYIFIYRTATRVRENTHTQTHAHKDSLGPRK